MKKGQIGKSLMTTAMLVTACGGQAMAGSGPTSMEVMQQQMQELINQNKQLAQRVGELEGTMAETNAKTAAQFKAMDTEKEERDVKKISDYVTLSGLIELEFALGDDFAGKNFNSFDTSKVELGLDIKANDWTSGYVLVKHEGDGDGDDFFIDEAAITLGNTEKFPFKLIAGKFYMPFGNFATNMIQDPLTQEIGELNDSGAAIRFEVNGFTAALYGYKGMDKTDDSDTMAYGAMAGYSYKKEDLSFTCGMSWTSNMGDTDKAIAAAFDDADLDTVETTVSAFGAHAGAGIGPLSLTGEYVAALDDFSSTEIEFLGQGAKPSAWNTELAYTTELFGHETAFAIGWQQTDEAMAIGLPETRYIGAASMEILQDTVLTLEYFHDNDYDMEDGGTGENAKVFTAQLAYEF